MTLTTDAATDADEGARLAAVAASQMREAQHVAREAAAAADAAARAALALATAEAAARDANAALTQTLESSAGGAKAVVAIPSSPPLDANEVEQAEMNNLEVRAAEVYYSLRPRAEDAEACAEDAESGLDTAEARAEAAETRAEAAEARGIGMARRTAALDMMAR